VIARETTKLDAHGRRADGTDRCARGKDDRVVPCPACLTVSLRGQLCRCCQSVRSDYHWAHIPGVVRGEYVKIIIDRQNAAAGADGASF